MILVALYEGLLYGIVFFLLKKAGDLFSDFDFIVQSLIWCSFEYLRTLGFLGVNYGVIGYSQWTNSCLLQSASLFGIHGINFMVVFPGCCFVSCLKHKYSKKRLFNLHKISFIIYAGVLSVLFVYGIVQLKKTDCYDEVKKIALVQNNVDTRLYYEQENNEILESYKQLINDSIKNINEMDLIVFPEGAVKPRILLNEGDYVPEEMYHDIVEYLNFFHSLNTPVVFGSTCLEYDGVRNGLFTYKAYNIACYLENKIQTIPAEIQVYKKRHLVPSIEKLPFVDFYQRKYTSFSDCLSSGEEAVVFYLDDIPFCTPICFEESFGYDVKSFMEKNPAFILSISSDLWSKSLACQYQHLAMEVFRALENRLPFLRASTTGQTVYINSKGACEQMLKPFTAGVLICDVPLCKESEKTLYTKTGDWFGILCVTLFIAFFIFKYIKKIKGKLVV